MFSRIYYIFTHLTPSFPCREEQASEQVNLLKEKVRKLERNWYANVYCRFNRGTGKKMYQFVNSFQSKICQLCVWIGR